MTAQEEGDYICQQVLRLCQAIKAEHDSPRDPAHPSPTYRELERLSR